MKQFLLKKPAVLAGIAGLLLTGLVAATHTPFHNDGTLNLAIVERQSEHLLRNNVSTAFDLARMVAAAHHYPLIREFSTTSGARAEVKGRELEFHNTNQLVSSPTWEIGLSKTGYIQEAGKCLVMQARVADKPVVIVLLDSAGKQTRIGDANRIKRWMESASVTGRQPTRV